MAGAVLGNGLLPDYSPRALGRAACCTAAPCPCWRSPREALSDAEKRAVVRFGLEQLLLSGATTVADLTHPAFAPALRAEGEALGLRLLAFPERTANGYPVAEHSGRLLVPERTGGSFAAGDALYSVETTSPEMYAAARASVGPLLVRAAYCESEKQVSRMAFGLSPWASSTARSS